MNKVIMTGNVARDPEIHTTNGGIKKASFTIAVQRRFANAQGVREADFFPVVVWRQLAEMVEKYVKKGMKLGVDGVLQSRQYDTQDGQKRNVIEIVADSIEFLSPKGNTDKPAETPETLTEENDPELPF